ncbi:MAG: ParB/RepB/Spo0J family partition protein [Anaerolineales bacterium]
MAKKRPGLGKGLDALIPSKRPEDEFIQQTGVMEIPIDAISTNPHQPRRGFNHDELRELATSIQEHGIIQPLVLLKSQEEDKKFSLIAGERRLKAAKMAGLETVPAILREVTNRDQLIVALIENVQRSDLNPLEEASAYQKLSRVFDLSHEEIGQRVGKSRTTITNTLRLLDLPDIVQQALRNGQISTGHARALLSLQNTKSQAAALQTILTKNLNVRQTESLVKKLQGKKQETKRERETQSPEVLDIQERLQSFLGTKVRVKQNKSGNGTITIHFYSEEELNSLLELFLEE